jgi:hypothetical protein
MLTRRQFHLGAAGAGAAIALPGSLTAQPAPKKREASLPGVPPAGGFSGWRPSARVVRADMT